MICKISASLYILSTILISHYEWGTKYNKLMASLLFIVVITDRLWKKKRLLEISPQHLLFLLWCVLATFSGLISGSGKYVLESTTRVSLVFFACIPLFMLLVDHLCMRWVSWTLVLAAIASSALINLGVLPPSPRLTARFAGTLGNSNLFAFVSLVGLANLTYLWRVHCRRLVKVLILLAGVLLSYQIILSGSRKGIIGVFLILLVQYAFFILKNREKGAFKRAVGGLIIFSCLLTVFTYFLVTSDYSYRTRNLVLYLKGERLERAESSIAKREYLIKVGLNNFMKSPIIGTGLSSFEDTELGVGIFTRNIGVYSHSNFIEVLVSSGAIGFILYYSIYWACIIQLLRSFKSKIDENNESLLYFATTAIAVLIFYEFFAVTYYGKEFWIFLSCILASVRILNRRTLSLDSSKVISD